MESAFILDFDLRLPAEIYTLESFRRWARSDAFPESGRIDYLDGEVEIDRSPEDLYTHGAVKAAISTALCTLVVEERDAGSVFIDRTRISSPAAGLSVEPDVVAVLWGSLDGGRVREIPAARGGDGRFIELEGAPDVVVEVLSDSSVKKDRERLPALYAKAGVPELWLVDARGEEAAFSSQSLQASGYASRPADADGWMASTALGVSFRLRRERTHGARWRYRLERRVGERLSPYTRPGLTPWATDEAPSRARSERPEGGSSVAQGVNPGRRSIPRSSRSSPHA